MCIRDRTTRRSRRSIRAARPSARCACSAAAPGATPHATPAQPPAAASNRSISRAAPASDWSWVPPEACGWIVAGGASDARATANRGPAAAASRRRRDRGALFPCTVANGPLPAGSVQSPPLHPGSVRRRQRPRRNGGEPASGAACQSLGWTALQHTLKRNWKRP